MPHLLPREYWFAHQYSVFLHDLIVAKLRAGLEANIFAVTIPLAPGDKEVFERLSKPDTYDWIEKRHGTDLTRELDFRLTLPRLLVDFCNFVLEGLRASAKGKLTVAYALFRKPFKDNLLYLEWMLGDMDGFLTALREQSPHALDSRNITDAQRRRIVASAIAAKKHGSAHTGILSAEFIYELRYDRSAAYGLAVPWDKAIHLVTGSRAARTEPHNLNFIFSDEAAREDQWQHIYQMIPPLLYHTVEVVDDLISLVATTHGEYDDLIRTRREWGFIAWMSEWSPQRQSAIHYGRRYATNRYHAPIAGKAFAFTCGMCASSC